MQMKRSHFDRAELTATSDASIPAAQPDPSSTFAALDLGSNSFHLLVVRDHNGAIQVIDKHREMVRMATGLDANGHLSHECMDRALNCLQRIGERLRSLPRRNVRVVGTNALRQAANSDAFISQAEAILGHNIDVISGNEEGRLIYAAVAQSFESRGDRRLVIDIGGGSTELAAGLRFEPQLMESLRIGCISVTERWFQNGTLSARNLSRAVQDAERELEVVKQRYRTHGWDLAIGTSGTVLAVQNSIAQFSAEGITESALSELRRLLVNFGAVANIDPTWCNTTRAQSLPGGVAILSGIFRSLKLEKLEVTSGALREGLLHDLLGRAHNDDIRERSVRALIPRFHIDAEHATLVAETALALFDQLYPELNEELEDDRQLLRWAALLHEIGMNISHSAYHKHGAYLLEHLDLPGFALSEQKQLGWLVRSHRRRVQLESHMPHDKPLDHVLVLLRLAVALRRNRADDLLPELTLKKNSDTYRVSLAHDWLDRHTLTKMDLAQETQLLNDIAVRLEVLEC